jgi:hypothetical protein
VRAPKKPVVKPVKLATGPTFYTQSGKPDPGGLYDKDGYMVKIPGKKKKKKPALGERSAEDIAAARRAGFNR